MEYLHILEISGLLVIDWLTWPLIFKDGGVTLTVVSALSIATATNKIKTIVNDNGNYRKKKKTYIVNIQQEENLHKL